MKLLFIALLIPSYVMAVGPVINPAETPQQVLTCVKPLQYTDETDIQVGDITELHLYQSNDGLTYSDQPVLSVPGANECRFTIDVTQLPAGQYYYAATAVAGSESVRSNSVPFEVQRIPKPPTLSLE